MKALWACYICMAIVNFRMSLENIEGWAFRKNENTMHKVVRWIVIAPINPIFFVLYWACWIYYFHWIKKMKKKYDLRKDYYDDEFN